MEVAGGPAPCLLVLATATPIAGDAGDTSGSRSAAKSMTGRNASVNAPPARAPALARLRWLAGSTCRSHHARRVTTFAGRSARRFARSTRCRSRPAWRAPRPILPARRASAWTWNDCRPAPDDRPPSDSARGEPHAEIRRYWPGFARRRAAARLQRRAPCSAAGQRRARISRAGPVVTALLGWSTRSASSPAGLACLAIADEVPASIGCAGRLLCLPAAGRERAARAGRTSPCRPSSRCPRSSSRGVGNQRARLLDLATARCRCRSLAPLLGSKKVQTAERPSSGGCRGWRPSSAPGEPSRWARNLDQPAADAALQQELAYFGRSSRVSCRRCCGGRPGSAGRAGSARKHEYQAQHARL